jgi:hypothetical protein
MTRAEQLEARLVEIHTEMAKAQRWLPALVLYEERQKLEQELATLRPQGD